MIEGFLERIESIWSGEPGSMDKDFIETWVPRDKRMEKIQARGEVIIGGVGKR